ncbi:hypothetical protein Scep_030296 [Stephania cephalantha]|uniref:Uncharacterized protein n=1 Tax=Stephania cephalantha TaxID=152367 RepID=A0AAP0E268_9MAGN
MAKSTQEKGETSTLTGSGLMKKRSSNTTPTRRSVEMKLDVPQASVRSSARLRMVGEFRHSLPPNSPTTPINVDGDKKADTHRREVRLMDSRACRRDLSTLHASFIGQKIFRTRRLDFDLFDRIWVWVRSFFHRMEWDGFMNTKEPLCERIGSGSFSRMTFYDVFLVWSILTGNSMDFAYIIVRHMLKASMDPQSALPYGNHLGKLFATVGLASLTPPRTGRDKNQNVDMIGVCSLLNMNCEFIFGDWVLVKMKKNESKKIRQRRVRRSIVRAMNYGDKGKDVAIDTTTEDEFEDNDMK